MGGHLLSCIIKLFTICPLEGAWSLLPHFSLSLVFLYEDYILLFAHEHSEPPAACSTLSDQWQGCWRSTVTGVLRPIPKKDVQGPG